MSEEQILMSTVKSNPTCLTCNKSFANGKSLATHRRKFHTYSELVDKLNDSDETVDKSTSSVKNEPEKIGNVKDQASQIPQKLERTDISAINLCYRLTPRIDLCDVVEILTYFSDSRTRMIFLTDDEKMFLTTLIEECNIMKVFYEIRDNCDLVRKILTKIHLAKNKIC